MAGSCDKSIFKFLRNLRAVFHNVMLIYILTSSGVRIFPTGPPDVYQHVLVFDFWMLAILIKIWWKYFTNGKWFWSFFNASVSCLYFILWKYKFISLAHFNCVLFERQNYLKGKDRSSSGLLPRWPRWSVSGEAGTRTGTHGNPSTAGGVELTVA